MIFLCLRKHKCESSMKHIPAWWLVDHHYFWSSEECADFVIKLRGYLKLFHISSFGGHFNHRMITKGAKFWVDGIPADGILRCSAIHIPRKGDPSLEKDGDPNLKSTTSDAVKGDPDLEPTSDAALKKSGWVKIASYKTNYDVVRYMTVVYSHYNDKEYEEFRAQKLDKAKIEQLLRKCFPDIYGDLFEALFHPLFEGAVSAGKM
ncbi:hypothetical protein OROMI_005074 [Orobanche minor]